MMSEEAPTPHSVSDHPVTPPRPPLKVEEGEEQGQQYLHGLYQNQNQNPIPGIPIHHRDRNLPGSTRLVDILGAAFHRFWRTSHTVLRLDVQRLTAFNGPHARKGARHTRQNNRYGHDEDDDHEDDNSSSSSSLGRWVRGLDGGGARLKLMQSWEFPDEETGLPGLPWSLNFGFGAKVQMDKGGHLLPQMRVKAKHFAFYILPLPLFELRGKWPIGGTRLAIDIRYRIPLLNVEHIWESPTSQLCVQLYNPLGTGFHLTPGGVEFDEHIINIGHHTKLRVAASVDFPRHFPLGEGEQPVRVHINRLGIKTRVS